MIRYSQINEVKIEAGGVGCQKNLPHGWAITIDEKTGMAAADDETTASTDLTTTQTSPDSTSDEGDFVYRSLQPGTSVEEIGPYILFCDRKLARTF